MKKPVGLVIAAVTIVSSLMFAFQNCSSGSVPNLNEQSATSVEAPQTLIPKFNSAMNAGESQIIGAYNALGTLSFQVTAGGTACTVDPISGNVVAVSALTSQIVCTVHMIDAGGRLPADAMITVSPPATQPVVIQPDSKSFDAATTTQFSMPNYNSMTIEVYGAGGGGGGMNYLMGGYATAGITGGETNVSGTSASGTSISLRAGGGGGGSPGASRTPAAAGGAGGIGVGDVMASGLAGGQVVGGKAGGPNGGAGGVIVYAQGGWDQQGQPGTAPGGGGGGRGSSEDPGYGGGGGGGGYAKVTVLPANIPAGTKLSIVVGAGGASGYHSSNQAPQGGAGANGRVVITWQ